MEQKIKKKIFAFEITAFELVVANFRNIQQDTWHRQAMCQQTHVMFQLTLGETFSKSTSLRMMKTHDKNALIEISKVFATLSPVDGQSVV